MRDIAYPWIGHKYIQSSDVWTMATFIIQLRIWGYENLYSSKYAKEDSSMNLRFAIITTNCNQITVKYEHFLMVF